ncbi:CASP8 and FADD-like apoptosis regulator isoform X1 [Pagrus major]|uniref:CASP8 and FADD-like apoptosis regulator isoform X1 n=1 Tax=Pagrus major TaxID=143350 RepID=UPI003CC8B06C
MKDITPLRSKSMALPDQQQLQAINQIADSLSSCERRRLFYLCESTDADNSEARMKEMLMWKVQRHDAGHLLLRELMLRLGRFDILRKVCKTSRDEVERTLIYRQVLPKFRVLMSNISEDMVDEDLDRVKFLWSGTLPREKLDKAKSFLDLIIELEKLDVVSPESVDAVEECLINIGRLDLAKKVSAYKTPVVTSEQHPSQQQRFRAARPFSASNTSHHFQQPRREQSRHSATANIPVPVYREQSCQSQLDWYKFNTNPRGVCVIIDCVGNDGDMLEQTFRALHFNVLLHKWLSIDETLSALRGIIRQRENFEGDSFVCCIISRGTAKHLLGTDSDSVGRPLDSVRRLFTADACPMLAGKPKLFFIQRYSVPESQPFARMDHRDEDLETDGCDVIPRSDIIPTDADVFWSHCWTQQRLLEQGHHRSVYLKALTDALQKGQRRKTHLLDVHTEVNRAIFEHNERNPGEMYNIDLKHTLRKDLYLQ